MDLTTLERAILNAILDLYPAQRDRLGEQLSNARVTNREMTGYGSFTDFAVNPAMPRVLDVESPLGTVSSKLGSDGYEIQFILFTTRDGLLNQLEGYSFGDGYGDLDMTTAPFTTPVAVDVFKS